MRFIDLFAGLGGFHLALGSLGHECVFASEIDGELSRLYEQNFPAARSYLVGDIAQNLHRVPPHDILCAGFPCQPFSKSGYQHGVLDTRGTLFHLIVKVLRAHRPKYLIIENVGNFEQHDSGRTWRIARKSLERLGYNIAATGHVKSGGHGLLSPHHLGYPQTRERFYAVGCRGPMDEGVLPTPDRTRKTDIGPYLDDADALTACDVLETALSDVQIGSVNLWNELLRQLPSPDAIPSFPLWSDEFGAAYAFEGKAPGRATKAELLAWTCDVGGTSRMTRHELLDLLPPYTRDNNGALPRWKVRFIAQNREWYARHRTRFPADWLATVRRYPASYRKLDWTCKGGAADLWQHVLQFRPSGIRVRRSESIPALVALTSSQVPVIGPKQRYLTRREGLRLQGFPDEHRLPAHRGAAFRALGNAVHVGVVRSVAARLLDGVGADADDAEQPCAPLASAS